MVRRVGLGPVFAFEWLTASRRWQGYALRSSLVLLLLLGLAGVWLGSHGGSGDLSIGQWAEVGRGFYAVTSLILLGLVGLAAPAATAGAICLDKARGNLTLLFATDLSDAEIVLGKLAARLVPVLGLIACAAPVQALATLLGGVDPMVLFGATLVCLACAAFGCTLALTLSVWGQKTHEVLLATYALGILYLLAAPAWIALSPMLPGWARPAWLPGNLALLPYNPIVLVLAPLNAAPLVPIGLGAQARFCTLGLLTSALLAAAATWRMRAVVIRQACWEEAARRAGRRTWTRRGPIARLARLLPSPSLDGNPVLWREWHRRRPSRWSVAVWGTFGLLSGGFSLWAIVEAVDGGGPGPGEMSAVLNGLQVAAGLLLLSVSAATSLAEERQRGSLDVLLATPLSTRSIVLGKWWGAFRGVPPLAVLPTLVAAALTTHTGFAPGPVLIGGLVVAYGAALTSLGLTLATWLPRMDRAIGLTAGAYVVVTIAAVPAGMAFFGEGPGEAGPGVASASPFWGVGFSSALFGGKGGQGQEIGEHAGWLAFWIGAYGLVSLFLLLATLKTFNRCLGRIDDPSPDEGPCSRLARTPSATLPDARPVPDLDLRSRPADQPASDH
ncbi:ABC transporter permease [Tautonia plasticadhaerens]|uniref:ABC-2 family transporter protein n=1 Tax=Tautonia plasticadhaerens TaxID=2527974 RepID=A0A518H1B5_9BACT|nr:ABC transporter permease [Tautonia plasticadhaerens]QDV34606.1 ABC-2 family transporter protein [Tautonia plasticadhaerens]